MEDTIKIFYSHSKKDKVYLEKFRPHLAVARNENLISDWSDDDIKAGTAWFPSIKTAVESCDIVVFLISAAFFDTPFILNNEVKPLLKRREKEDGIEIYSIILRASQFDITPLFQYQARPQHLKPIASLDESEQDEQFNLIASEIRQLAIKIREKKKKPAKKEYKNRVEKHKWNDGAISDTEDDARIPESSSSVEYVIVLSATIDAVNKPVAEALIEHLQQICNDSTLTLKGINQGSVILVLQGSEDGFKKISSLFKSGELNDLCGFRVELVQLNAENTEYLEFDLNQVDDEGTTAVNKTNLIEEIRSQGGEGRDLRGVNFRNATLYSINLSRANLSAAILNNAVLIAVNLESANLKDVDLSDAILWHTNLSGADLEDANLNGTDLRYTTVDAKTKLDHKWQLVQRIVNVNRKVGSLGLDLSDVDLSRANLSQANLSEANLTRTNFLQSNLTSANLDQANLVDANLTNADLRNAHLLMANLTNANLSGAAVRGARFGENLGISEKMKYGLIRRGAIFEDAPGDRSRVLMLV
jgi:uncharacterized protein YjbI with pentapeptide repeats